MKKSLLSFFLLAAVAASAQKVSNKISFKKGQTIEVTTNMNMATQSMMGEMPASIVSTDSYVVGEVNENEIQLVKAPKQIKFSATMMGQEMNMDSDNPKDLEGQMGAPVKEMMKQKQELTVDAAGVVTSVKAGEKNKEKSGQGDMMAMMLPGLNANTVLSAGQPTIFKILPAREVAKGDTWTDTSNVNGNTSSTTYVVKDITATDILLDYTGTGKTASKQSMMGMSADVATESKTSGTVSIDKATGLMKQKTLTSNTATNMNMNGNAMESTTKSTAVITVKVL